MGKDFYSLSAKVNLLLSLFLSCVHFFTRRLLSLEMMIQYALVRVCIIYLLSSSSLQTYYYSEDDDDEEDPPKEQTLFSTTRVALFAILLEVFETSKRMISRFKFILRKLRKTQKTQKTTENGQRD